MNPDNSPPARSRPRDSEIIDVLALAFSVENAVVAEWLLGMDAARLVEIDQKRKAA